MFSLLILILATLVTHGVHGIMPVYPPLCSIEGMKVGAGLGSVVGAVGGVATTGGAATLATCPSLMISTLGHGLVSQYYQSSSQEYIGHPVFNDFYFFLAGTRWTPDSIVGRSTVWWTGRWDCGWCLHLHSGG